MSVRRLRYFVAAAEAQNFGRAAKLMNVAIPALSRQIHDLESELGVVLFNRVGRRITLSTAGAFYLLRVKEILRAIESAHEDVRRFARGDTESLVVGLQEMAGYQDGLLAAVWDFRRAAPHCTLRLEPMMSAAQLTAILDHSIDVGFVCIQRELPPGLASVNVAVNHWRIAVADHHRLVNAEAVSVADVADEDFVFVSDALAPEIFSSLFAKCAAAGLTPRIVRRAATASALFGLIAAGVGISLVHTPVQLPPSIVLKTILDLDLPVPLDLIWRRDDTRPSLLQFIDIVSRRAAPPRPGGLIVA